MSAPAALLGAIEWDEIVRRWRTMTPAARDRVVILGALALVTLLVVIWAVAFRRKGRHSHSHRHSYEYPRASGANATFSLRCLPLSRPPLCAALRDR